ncbi:MarR family winged helix-turn-helix transcriptional regulator [Paenibacillus crassostreae]|uniref:MarR family transcriptional regulator n=1 Tax=Paenibacillus crassostreae TaxID=1763538 RepID=A0A167G3K2_9BACL|nr:MarR family transcriptional regulator [Paenibacillus crassostreae]AOZ94519.1 transcriptional regulator [Paenibacillus crassostreae]OAB77177.1 MarR family transcriptional regulator [Paenibacillus crassostreae]
MHLNKHIATRFEQCAGVSPNRLELLCKLTSGQISQSDLQKAVSIDPAAVTRHVQQLEAEGILLRTRSESDNRVTLVQLTEEGKHKVAMFKAEKDRFLEELQEDLTESERLGFIQALRKLNSQIQRMKETSKTN